MPHAQQTGDGMYIMYMYIMYGNNNQENEKKSWSPY